MILISVHRLPAGQKGPSCKARDRSASGGVHVSVRWSETTERNAADGPFSPAGLGLVPLVHVPAARVLPAAFLSWSNSGQALFSHENLRRIVQRQMRQSVGEHLQKLQLELLGSRRGDDRVQLVKKRVSGRIIPS